MSKNEKEKKEKEEREDMFDTIPDAHGWHHSETSTGWKPGKKTKHKNDGKWRGGKTSTGWEEHS